MSNFNRAVLGEVLKNGIKQLQLELNETQVEQLLDYLALLNKWNSVYNLTSVRDPMQMVTVHLLDSLLQLEPAIHPARRPHCQGENRIQFRMAREQLFRVLLRQAGAKHSGPRFDHRDPRVSSGHPLPEGCRARYCTH